MQSESQSQIHLLKDIAPAQAMQISVADYSGDRLELSAPLDPNLNDKGTAFGGSISSMLILAGWGLVMLRLREAGRQNDVVVSHNETNYKRPVRAELRSVAKVDPDQMDSWIKSLSENPRSPIEIEMELISEGESCATMVAHYVALM